jgi:hypothetical protein
MRGTYVLDEVPGGRTKIVAVGHGPGEFAPARYLGE